MSKDAANPGGRPTLYDPRLCSIVSSFGKLGLTDSEIADALEINVATLYRWKIAHAEFCDALNDGKIFADAKVAQALFEKACAGDTVACIFWLKNRRPAQWRNTPDVADTVAPPQPERIVIEIQDGVRTAAESHTAAG